MQSSLDSDMLYAPKIGFKNFSYKKRLEDIGIFGDSSVLNKDIFDEDFLLDDDSDYSNDHKDSEKENDSFCLPSNDLTRSNTNSTENYYEADIANNISNNTISLVYDSNINTNELRNRLNLNDIYNNQDNCFIKPLQAISSSYWRSIISNEQSGRYINYKDDYNIRTNNVLEVLRFMNNSCFLEKEISKLNLR